MEAMNHLKALQVRSVLIYRLSVSAPFHPPVCPEEIKCRRLHIKTTAVLAPNTCPGLWKRDEGCARPIKRSVIYPKSIKAMARVNPHCLDSVATK